MSKNISFLDAMWPILSIMRLLGWFPVRRVRDKLEFSLVWCLVSAVVYPIQLVSALVIVYRGILLIPKQDPGLHLLNYLSIGSVATSQCIAIGTICSIVPHLAFYRNFVKFQVTFARICKGPRLQFDVLRRWTRWIPFIVIAPFLLNQVLRPAISRRWPNFGMDFHIGLETAYLILATTWWRGIMQAISESSKQLLQRYKDATSRPILSYEKDAINRILAFRVLWLQLCQLLVDSGQVLTFTIGMELLLLLGCLSFIFYLLLSFQSLTIVIYYGTYTLIFLWAFSIICLSSNTAATQINKDIMNAIQVTDDFLLVPHNLQFQMSQFFRNIRRNSPEVTLRGFVTLNADLMYQLIPSLISNIVLLKQLIVTERKLDPRSFFNVGNFVTYSDA